ncbi:MULTISPECIES: cation:proton antiporter [Streptomyces]|uniref:Cation:proton antiporter n=1 Tax=Streptomyces koelreuteriae TaxID=2838015 RepID=A0ABX8G2T0_9ACTN|nr:MULTISPECIES: cation:proton antiporter [Streptomyces]QWB27786.1 cation:proton antiporter [Streptomyces koelreuteriae]UUA10890.1 cation:proton antiporter [Streptomyces koelreuteriae]UUA18496.1 cation:proton antiporter [Streptomyces sp. CRCS-T-1]
MHSSAVFLIEFGCLILGLGLLGRLAGRFRFSPIPLYLLAGLAFGKGGLLPLGASEDFVAIGAEIGVILLLLMLGLEYTAADLVSNLRTHYRAGLVDAVLNALPGAALALLLGWGPVAAVVLAGVTWVSSSGVIAKVLGDLGRLGNRETPAILSILVLEDLSMAIYLPIVTALLAGVSLAAGAVTLAIALGVATVVLVLAVRYGRHVSRFVSSDDPEKLLLVVLGVTLVVAGLAQQLQVSAAVGAFLVGIALSGEVAEGATSLLAPLRDLFAAVFFVFFGLHTDPASIPPVLLPALALAAVTTATKIATGYWAARRAGIGPKGRWRAGGTLVARGEFSIVIAGLAVTAGIEPSLGPLATAYVLILVLLGPLTARWTEPVATLLTGRVRRRKAPPVALGAHESIEGQDPVGRA